MSSDALTAWQEHSLSEEKFKLLNKEDQVAYLNLLKVVVKNTTLSSLQHYTPHEKQREFHTARQKIRAIFGGNQSGKTFAGSAEFCMHMTGVYPDWYPQEMRYAPDILIKGRIGAADFQKGVMEIILPALERWIDPSLIARKIRNPVGVPVKWIFRNGREFDIVTYEQKLDQYEGWQGDLAWFDEPPPRDRYIATLRGLIRTKGRIWLTLTPLKEPWLYDEIYQAQSPDIFCTTVNISDNPYLDKDEIDKFSNSIRDDAVRDARIHGKFKHLSGLVYSEFSHDTHVIDPIKPNPYWTTYFAIDPHPRTPTACLWLAVNEQDTLVIYDELYLEGMSIRQIAMAIKAQEGECPARFRFIDPALDKKDELMGGVNVREEFMKYGIACQRANNNTDLGIDKVHDALRIDYLPLVGKELPRLRVCRNCTNTIYEFTHYLWNEYLTRPEEHDKMNKPKKLRDHFMDCIKYIMNANPRYLSLSNEEATDIIYKGEYTKYPTKTVSAKVSSYHDLIEERGGKSKWLK